MKRRDFLRALATGAAGVSALGTSSPAALSAPRDLPDRFLLSEHGCGRATGYAKTNKIVTLEDKTHVAWLDSQGKGFQVRIRTLDHGSGEWSQTYTVGEAYDNHGGPALTVDGKGLLHIVYYPHGHPFRYRRSTRPNDASEWEEERQFGARCTYPTLLCGPDDTLYLTCRELGRKFWGVDLYTKAPGADWQGPAQVLRSEYPGYSNFQETLAWSPDHRTLHLSGGFFGGSPQKVHAIGYLTTPDFGKTWRRYDGARVELPATAKTVSGLAEWTKETTYGLSSSVVVDSAGKPHVLFASSPQNESPVAVWIASPGESGAWSRRTVISEMPDALANYRILGASGLTIGSEGRWYLLLQVINAARDADTWGHPGLEIIGLESEDSGRSFTPRLLSPPDLKTAHWLMNIERPTGHNRVTLPGVIYTAGPAGERNTDVLSNGVYWTRLDPAGSRA